MTIENNQMQKRTIRGILSDLRYLVKGFVLIANVLPIISGFWLALYFTNESFFNHWEMFVILTVGSIFLMSGALILNNWYEVDLDVEMKRTQKRPTVTGNFSMNTVLWLGIISSVLGMGILLFTTVETAVYGLLAWVAYVILYTFWTKRRYTLNTIIGSVSGAFTPLMGWAAIESAYHIIPIVLFIILFIWQIPHTFAIAMRRHDEYKAANVPMLPVVHGFEITKRQNAIYVACLLPFAILLKSVGTFFVFITLILNLIWLYISIRGLFRSGREVDAKYADTMFYMSLTYLTVVFGGMIVVTLPFFN